MGGDECVTENKWFLCDWNKLTSPFTSCSFFHCVGIGYSMFSHGGLNRTLDMKSPPPLNLGADNLRGDATNQGIGATRTNYNSAVCSSCYPVWSMGFFLLSKLRAVLQARWAQTFSPFTLCAVVSLYHYKYVTFFSWNNWISLFIRGESCTRACTAAAQWLLWAKLGCWVTVWGDMASPLLEPLVRLLFHLSGKLGGKALNVKDEQRW